MDIPVLPEEGEESSGGMIDDPPDEGGNDDDDMEVNNIVEMALQGRPIQLNGVEMNPPTVNDEADTDMAIDGGESRNERFHRSLNSSQDEVSDPDEWADVHFGHMNQWQYERMQAFSQANQNRLRRAAEILRGRHEAAVAQNNWEEAQQHLNALHGVESLMDIA